MSETDLHRSESTPDQLFRSALGGQLRRMRTARGEHLDETAKRAGISPQYLSEVERGRKDASSEMISAILGALDSSLVDTLGRIARELGGEGHRVIDIRSAHRRGEEHGRPRAAGPHLLRAA